MNLYRTEKEPLTPPQPQDLPGTVTKSDGIYFPVNGQFFKVEGMTFCGQIGYIPVLDLPVVDVPRSGRRAKRA